MQSCLHIELAAAALKRHEEYAFRAWLYLRAAGHGQGHCRLDRYRAFLRTLGFRRTEIEKTVMRLMESRLAAPRFTRHGHEVLVPLTTRQMTDRYGIAASRWRVDIPLRDLKGKGLRNQLFAYVEAGLGDSPRARITLRELTGVSTPTQIRGEQRMGAKVTENFIRVDLSTVERAPLVAEGNEGHRGFADTGSAFIQTSNSVSYPAIPRRKRVVYGSCGPCRDISARQPTDRRRYHTSMRGARRQKVWRVKTPEGERLLPVVVAEKPFKLGGTLVNVWGVL